MSSRPSPREDVTLIASEPVPTRPDGGEPTPTVPEHPPLLRSVVETARVLGAAAAVAFLLYEPADGGFLPGEASGLDDRWRLGASLDAAQGLARYAVRQARPVTVQGNDVGAALETIPLRDGRRVGAAWVAPLSLDGQVVGALQLYYADVHAASIPADAGDSLIALSSGAIGAVQAHARERGRRGRLEALDGASKALAGELSLQQLLQRIVDLAVDLAGARYGALGVAGSDGYLTNFITSGLTDEERERIGPLPRGHGLLGVLIRQGESLRVAEIGRDPRSVGFPPNHPPMTTLLGVPIRVRDEVVGDLYLTEKLGGAEFSAEDQHLIELLAAHAGIAIENARLHDRERAAHAALQQALDSLRFLTEADMVLASSLDYRATLHNVARRAVPYLADWCSVVMLGEDGGVERVASAAVDPDGEALLRQLYRRFAIDAEAPGGLARALRTGQTEFVAAVTAEDLATFARGYAQPEALALLAPRSYLIVPLRSGGQTMGAIIYARITPDRAYEQREVRLAEDLALHAALAVANARAHAQVGEVTRLRERERISRDLHDGIIQNIYAVTLQMEDVAEDLPTGAPQTRLLRLVDSLTVVIADVRAYIQDLRARELRDRLLADGVASLVREVEEQTGLSLRFALEGDPYRLPDLLANTILQVTREALANIVKHARARTARVVLTYEPAEVTLEVGDDGRGFDPARAVGAEHHGLRNLRGRAEEVGGTLEVLSRPDTGTTLVLRVPAQRVQVEQ